MSVFKSDFPEPSAELGPGEVGQGAVLVGSAGKDWRVKIEALDSAGVVVFCGFYSFLELDSLDWMVEIVDGENNCPVIHYRNSTGGSVVVFRSGLYAPLGTLAAGEVTKRPTKVDGNDASGMMVEALDSAGTLVFCREYSYGEFQQQQWLVDIVAGENNCAPNGIFYSTFRQRLSPSKLIEMNQGS